MPKKEVEYEKIINIRVTDNQYDLWTDYAGNEENQFTSLSSMIRYAVDELIVRNQQKEQKSEHQEELERKITELNQKIEDILSQNQEILKIIANKSRTNMDDQLIEYQKQFIINLLKEKPRDELDLKDLIPNITETEVLTILNHLLEATIIEQEGDKYKYREVI